MNINNWKMSEWIGMSKKNNKGIELLKTDWMNAIFEKLLNGINDKMNI